MKKLGIAAIVCAVVFLGFAITGGICFGIGVANLAADSNFTEMIQTYGDDVFSMLESTQEYASYEGSESYEIHEGYEAIKVSGFTGDVTIRPYTASMSGYTVLVEYTGLYDNLGTDGKHFNFSGNGHTLTISPVNDLTNHFNIGVFNVPNAGEITIYLPQYTDLSVPLELDLIITDTVGEVNVNGFTFGDITLSDTVGEINFEDVRAGMITCEDTIGEINADGEFAGISISDTIGECEIESDTALTLDSKIEGNIAEVKVSLPRSSQYYFTTSNSMGSVIIDNELKGGSGNVSFNISGSMGNVIIEADS